VKPYLIVAHDYKRISAGARVLHLLCHHLNEMGCQAWVVQCETNPWLRTPVARDRTAEWLTEDGIVIYPEVENGNPLGAARVVRYLLNIPNRIRSAEFLPGEMTWCYCDLLSPWVPSDDRVLYVPVVDETVFQPRQDSARKAIKIYWTGKGADERRVPETSDALEISFDWPTTAGALALLFQMSQIFYSYTNYTAMILESRLCGCPTVVIPNGLWHREQFVAWTPGGMNGLAWGTAKHELARAQSTVGAFQHDYQEYVAGFDERLARFVQQTQEWADGRP